MEWYQRANHVQLNCHDSHSVADAAASYPNKIFSQAIKYAEWEKTFS